MIGKARDNRRYNSKDPRTRAGRLGFGAVLVPLAASMKAREPAGNDEPEDDLEDEEDIEDDGGTADEIGEGEGFVRLFTNSDLIEVMAEEIDRGDAVPERVAKARRVGWDQMEG